MQTAPPRPQAPLSVAVRHWPRASQQPAHEELHTGPPLHAEASTASTPTTMSRMGVSVVPSAARIHGHRVERRAAPDSHHFQRRCTVERVAASAPPPVDTGSHNFLSTLGGPPEVR
jgi:hypothetical protein